jgi:sugar O-acyltransferase (sialic acid O-acetyltransferase NeuD family)
MAGLIVIGAGGHATSCADVANSAGYDKLVFVDEAKKGGALLGFPIVARVEDAQALTGDAPLLIAIGDNAIRARVADEMLAAYPAARFPCLIHRTAYVSPFAGVDEGSVVMAGAVVGPNTQIGRFCIVNTHASVDHDCRLEAFSSFAPGAVCGGGVRVGARAAISIGAVIRHGVEIGADTVLGAHSYAHRSMPEKVVGYGSPAKVIRTRAPGERYL